MNTANPLWGAPRIHGELLKLGIEISQATVAKYMVRRRGRPSPTWRSFLRNQAAGIAAIDMFVVASASFQLLYVMIILTHDRRRIVRFDVTRNPTAGWLARQITEAFPWDTAPRYLLRDRDSSYGQDFRKQVDAMGIAEVVSAARSPWQNAYVERVIGSLRRVPRLYSNLQRAPSASRPLLVYGLCVPLECFRQHMDKTTRNPTEDWDSPISFHSEIFAEVRPHDGTGDCLRIATLFPVRTAIERVAQPSPDLSYIDRVVGR
jgi:hypothetical protein